MINKVLFAKWLKARRTSRQAIYERIKTYRKKRGYAVTNEEAAYVLAAQDGIDIARFLTPQELNAVRQLSGYFPRETSRGMEHTEGRPAGPALEAAASQKPARRRTIAPDASDETTKEVRKRLENLNPNLGDAYSQVIKDLQDAKRLSFRSTGNEMREILRDVLYLLAPDDKVMAEPGYAHEQDQNSPTRGQRLKYIFKRQGGETERDTVAAGISVIDGGVSKLTLVIYKRSNRSTHTVRERTEAKRLLSYLNPILLDLLGKED